MKQLILALDHHPDTHLTGLLLANARGTLENAGLKVEFQISKSKHFLDSAAMRVANKQAHIGLSTPDQLLYFHTIKNNIPLIAVSAPVQKNFHRYAVQKNSGINSFKDFKGKRFAVQGTFSQLEELRYFMLRDSDCDMMRIENTCGLQALKDNKADIVHLNSAWEGLLAPKLGLELNYFGRTEEDLIYGYSPIYIALADTIEERIEDFKLFFKKLDVAYCFASANPQKAASELHKAYKGLFPFFDNEEFLQESMKMLAESFVDGLGRWGVMNENIWKEFLLATKRIYKSCRQQLHSENIKCDYSCKIFSNELLPY